MANPGAALGEAIGKLIEKRISEAVRNIAEPKGLRVEAKKLRNGSGNDYQIDCVISDDSGRPVIIIDPKYIRYTKHNRDKGSWLCTAHYNLRKTFPSIRKSITVLSGNWSTPSLNRIRSFGIEVHRIPFTTLVDRLGARGVEFAWIEKESDTPMRALTTFQSLPVAELRAIADEVTAEVLPDVLFSVEETLNTDLTTIQRRVSKVEVLLKTTHDEFILRSYDSVREAMSALLNLLEDRSMDAAV